MGQAKSRRKLIGWSVHADRSCIDCGQARSATSRCTSLRCKACSKVETQRRHGIRERTPPRATHIAGYVPSKGSVVQMFFGRVIDPLRMLGT